MLALPVNRGSTTSLSEPYFTFLKSIYGEASTDKLVSDISGFQTLRDSAVLIYEPTESGIQTLLKLNHQYSSFVPRLNGYQNELRTNFRWYDGFRTSKSIVSTCLYVDLACFLLNLGALQSLLGSKQERSTDEGIKIANKYFQQSAGIFDHILTKIYPLCTQAKGNDLLSGLSPAGLSMSRDLMLSQAQLCFYEKAVREKKSGNMKAAVVAKLALQTSIYFENVKKSLVMEPLVSTLDPSWIGHIDYQIMSFKAAAEFWQSVSVKEIALEKGKGYSEEIVRLGLAEKYMNIGLREAKRVNLNALLIQTGESLYKTIVTSKQKAENDNKSVYMETLPQESSLVPITPASMVKPIHALLSEYKPNGNNETLLFSKVMPSTIRQYINSYNTEMETIIMKATKDAGNNSNTARTTLSSVGLPGSLEAYKAGGKLPDNLWSKIQHAQTMGGKAELEIRLRQLDGTASRSMQTMASIFGNIQRQEREDNEFSGKYPNWSGARSTVFLTEVKDGLSQMKAAFSQAQDSDQVIKKEFQDAGFLEHLNILCMSRDEISKLLPAVNTSNILLDFLNDEDNNSSNQGNGVNTKVLETKLVELAQLIETRQKILAVLEALGNKDISHELLSNYVSSDSSASTSSNSGNNTSLPDIVSQHINNAEETVTELTNSFDKQNTLINEILKLNHSFHQACKSDTVILSRNKVIQTLEETIAKFFNIITQISAGITFYTNFQSRLTLLQQNTDDLIYTQQLQRQEFEHNFSQEQLRISQEKIDREYAERLSQEMQQVNINTGTAASTVTYPQLPPHSASSATRSQSTVNVNNSKTSVHTNGVPFEVSYGQPVKAPPASAVSTQQMGYQYNPSQSSNSNSNSSTGSTPTAPYFVPSNSSRPNSTSNNTTTTNSNNIASGMSNNSVSTNPDMHNKALRLCEMGFSYDQCLEMLKVNDGDEMNALNSLLSSSHVESTMNNGNASVAPPKPSNKPTPSGLSHNWGK